MGKNHPVCAPGVLRFLHAPRTGGSSIRRSWLLDDVEYRRHEIPTVKPGGAWWYGFTRNPWDRVVSLYEWGAKPGVAFRDFVLGGMKSNRFDHRFKQWIEPTTRWLKVADFVGTYEYRTDALGWLASLLGRPVPELHIGPSKRRHASTWDYYDADTEAWVRDFYASDIEHFGYDFGFLPAADQSFEGLLPREDRELIAYRSSYPSTRVVTGTIGLN